MDPDEEYINVRDRERERERENWRGRRVKRMLVSPKTIRYLRITSFYSYRDFLYKSIILRYNVLDVSCATGKRYFKKIIVGLFESKF